MTPQGSVSYRPNYVGVPLESFRRDNKGELVGALESVQRRLTNLRETKTAGDATDPSKISWSRNRGQFSPPKVVSLADFSGGGARPTVQSPIRSAPVFMRSNIVTKQPKLIPSHRPDFNSNNGPDMRPRPSTSGGFCKRTMYQTSSGTSDDWIKASYNGSGLPPNRTMNRSRVPVRSGFTRALKMDHDANPMLKNNGFTLTDTQMMYRNTGFVVRQDRSKVMGLNPMPWQSVTSATTPAWQ
jgi:hypothetical protein